MSRGTGPGRATSTAETGRTSYVPPPDSIPTLPIPDLSRLEAVHLVGIGGAGMSGMARLLLARGVAVSGSDLKDSTLLAQLRATGAAVSVGHHPDNVGSAGAVVVSTAIPSSNVEVVEARDRGIPVYARAQVLAALMADQRGIAVAGTHGKTTTTSMLAAILERAGADPTYLVGGDLNESGSNARSGEGDLFVAEADESDGSFLLLHPDVAVVTNVEEDHMDFYADRAEVEGAFAAFCRQARVLVACGDDPGVRRVVQGVERLVTYGEGEENDVRVGAVEVTREGSRGMVRFPEGSVEVRVASPGRHYVLNAAGALAAAREVGVAPSRGAPALAGFAGVRRRFERRGTARGAEFVDDYAHHPTEIAATLAAARAHGANRMVAVFQPHRYSRTATHWRPLGQSLAAADLVVVSDVYGAGELPIPGVTGKLLIDSLLESAPKIRAVYLPHRADLAPFLAGEIRSGDLVLTLGAGDITMVGEETLALIEGGGPR
jgi:UDP-N-acetylmuramate--alanine ligase